MKLRALGAFLLAVGVLQLAGQTPGAAPDGRPPIADGRAAPELSTIVVPIRATLATLSPELEARVPKTFADRQSQNGFEVRYDVARDPIRLRMIGPGLHATTVARYALEACRGRFPCISCGFGEPRREAQITLHTKLAWDPSWRIRSTTTPLPVHYARRCEVTWFDFDITGRYVAPAVEQQLAIAAKTIDQNISALTNLRPHAQQIWSSLQQPSELAPRTWLVMEPTALSLTPISGSELLVTSTLAMQARTRVVVGDKPSVVVKPLPALRVAPQPAAGMRVPFDVELPYDEASRLMAAEFAGKTYKAGGRDLRVEAVRVTRAASGKLLLEATIDYRGGAFRNYRGLVQLEGTPQFDAATQSIAVPDLDYSLERRRNPFFRFAERAVHDTLRTRLREAARFPLATRLAAIRDEITRALTRPLANGIFMRGRADAIQPSSVTPLPNVISIRVVATGAATVEVQSWK